ncbi:hypothetical protein, partial [Pseudomonas sp. DWR1-3-2b2]|uniref:hypothetical protein n=1 Tax=unclassified Pseudomonas TaxID=196821 RepID=UPI003CF506AF
MNPGLRDVASGITASLGKAKIEGATLALWAVVGGIGMLAVFSTAQNKTPSAFANGVSEFNLDDDLL